MAEDGPKPLQLSLNPAVEEHPFKDTFFEVTVYLQDADGQLKCGVEVALAFRLDFAEAPHPAPEGLLQVDRADVRIDRKTGVKIAKCSMEFENKAFRLVVAARDNDKKGRAILEAHSGPLKVMRYQLRVEEEEEDQWEEVWYKDEGGREKCITLRAKLVDERGALVTKRTARIKVMLHYAESLLPVTNQEILKLVGDGGATGGAQELKIERGLCRVRFRIDDVSKNHQGQYFRVKLLPDTANSPTDCDIAHDYSKKVLVRSKRNRRPQAQRTHRPTTTALMGGSNTNAPTTTMMMMAPPLTAGGGGGGLSPPSIMGNNNNLVPGRDAERLMMPPPTTTDMSGEHRSSLRAAQRAQSEWITAARIALAKMQWRVIGSEQLPDGSRRPHFDMSNPNELIDRLLRSYEADVAASTRQMNGHVDLGSTSAMSSEDNDGSDDDDHHLHHLQHHHHHHHQTARKKRRTDEAFPTRPEPLSAAARQRTSIAGVYEIIDALSPANGRGAHTTTTNNNNNNNMGSSSDFMQRLPSVNFDVNHLTDHGNPADGLSLAPSSLGQRGVSSLYVGEQVAHQAFEKASEPLGLAEQCVTTLVAKFFKPNRPGAVPLGFPAFDAENRLVGLYREGRGRGTHFDFVARSAGANETGLEPGDAELAEAALEDELDRGSDSVMRLSKHGTQQKLVESAAIYHWSKEAFTTDDTTNDISSPHTHSSSRA